MLAYQTPRGLAHYVGGSGLNGGTPQYRLGTATICHADICALVTRRRSRGRRVPVREEATSERTDLHPKRGRESDHVPPLPFDQPSSDGRLFIRPFTMSIRGYHLLRGG